MHQTIDWFTLSATDVADVIIMMLTMMNCCRAGRLCQETDFETDPVWTFCCSDHHQSTGRCCQEIPVDGTVKIVLFFILLKSVRVFGAVTHCLSASGR